MTEPSPGAFRLPVWNIVRDTFLIPWRHPREFLKPLALPGLVIALFTIGGSLTRGRIPTPVGLAVYAVYAAVFTVFAVTCHRLVLLGPSADTLAPKARWGLRETRFLAWVILMAIIVLVARLVLMTVVNTIPLWTGSWDPSGGVPHRPQVSRSWMDAANYLGLAIGTYFAARVSPVLPATAVDGPATLPSAWRLSAGNGWRLVVIVTALPWALSYGVSLLYRQNATLPELAILVVLSVLISMLGIIALSLSYQDLTSGRGIDRSVR